MLRGFVIGLGIVLTAGSVIGVIFGCSWGMLGPFIFGTLLIVGTVFEPRYRKRDAQPAGTGWAPTGEKFEDPETGSQVEVWYNSGTGERRYVPLERQ